MVIAGDSPTTLNIFSLLFSLFFSLLSGGTLPAPAGTMEARNVTTTHPCCSSNKDGGLP